MTTVKIDLNDAELDRVASDVARDHSAPSGVPLTITMPVYTEVAGVRHEIGTVDVAVTVDTASVAEKWFRSPESAAAEIGIQPGPTRAPDPEAVDALDAERAARAQARAGVASATVVESTLRDITPYECAQSAAIVLRGCESFIPAERSHAAAVANAWLSLGLAMATHGPLNKPTVEGDR